MYGFHDGKLLSWMKGREILQVGVGRYELVFNFHPAGNMTVAGKWELIDSAGQVIDRQMEHELRTESRIHYVVGPMVSDVKVESTDSMVVSFSNGFQLRLIDDDPRYEAVIMDPGDGTMIVA